MNISNCLIGWVKSKIFQDFRYDISDEIAINLIENNQFVYEKVGNDDIFFDRVSETFLEEYY